MAKKKEPPQEPTSPPQAPASPLPVPLKDPGDKTKGDIIEEAVVDLGSESNPVKVGEWIKAHYGETMRGKIADSTITQETSKKRKKHGYSRGGAAKPSGSGGSSGVSVDTIRAVRDLVAANGEEGFEALLGAVEAHGVAGLRSALEIVKLFGK